MNKKKAKLLIALVVVIGGIGALVATSMSSTLTYYMTPSELLTKVADDGESVYGERVRVGGTVITDTTKGKASTRKWEFKITDSESESEMILVSLKETVPSNRITVKYNGILPDTFQDGVIAIADGTLDENGVFTADSILAKCPSKYEPTDEQQKDMADKGKADKEANRDAGDKVIEQDTK